MPRAALALCVLWFVSLFLFRAALQRRRTGSTGIKGFRGRPGSLPWIAGVAASLGLVLAPLAPLSALLHWPSAALLFVSPPLHVSGSVLALLGIAGALTAQVSMGDSWRVGVDEAEQTQLVTNGMFAWVRNPIFSFIAGTLVGLVLMVPNLLALLAAALTILGIEIQVRAVEEPYLMHTHGATYASYAENVGRFVPAVGRLRG